MEKINNTVSKQFLGLMVAKNKPGLPTAAGLSPVSECLHCVERWPQDRGPKTRAQQKTRENAAGMSMD